MNQRLQFVVDVKNLLVWNPKVDKIMFDFKIYTLPRKITQNVCLQ